MFCALVITAIGGTGTLAGDDAKVDKELKKFHGVWKIVSVEAGGKALPIEGFKEMTVVFKGDKYSVKKGGEVFQVAKQKLDPSKSPKTMDVTIIEGNEKGAVMKAIYEIDADRLKVCFDPAGKERPTEFKSTSGSQVLVVHKRAKK